MFRKDIREKFSDLGLDAAANEIENIDIHCIIVDTLRSYIQKATGNPNIIIVLPNLNIICRQVINEVSQNSRNFKDLETSSYTHFGGLLYDYANAEFVSQNKEYVNQITKVLAHKDAFVRNILYSFGLDYISARSAESILREEANKLSNKIALSTVSWALPYSSIVKFQSNERNRTAEDRFSTYFRDHDFFSVLEAASNKGIPDHWEKIKNIISSIQEASKEEYPINLGLYSETDLKLLKYWSEGTLTIPISDYYTFGGYNKLDKNREVLIFGDQALISQYLYGKIDLMNKHIKKIKKQSSLKEKQNLNSVFDAFNPWDIDEDNILIVKDASATTPDYVSVSPKYSEREIKNNIVSLLKEIPLHPLDYFILSNITYNREIRKLTTTKAKSTIGAFGDISYLPDEFAYMDEINFSEKEKEHIKEEQIPVFRYNTQNPNILDLNFKFGPVYLKQLKMGFKKKIERRASAVVEGILPEGIGSFPIRTRGAAIAYLVQKNYSSGLNKEDKQEILNSLSKNMSLDLVRELGEETAVGAIAAVIEELEKDNLKGLVEVKQLLPGNPQSIMTDFMENMYREALNINIKTLPTFHISNMHNISDPCIVFAQDVPITQSVKPPRNLMNKFYSGLYKIMGYKHIITTSSAQSEFKLVKNNTKYSSEEEKKTK